MSDTYHFEVGHKPRIEFRVQSGRIDCEPGPDGSIGIDVSGRGADAVEIEQVGDTVVVREEKTTWLRTGSIRITATLPVSTDVELSCASTDMYLNLAIGDLVVRTASGDVNFEASKSLEIKTASGDVRGVFVEGDARIGSASGDLVLDRVGGDLSATLASGDVRAGEVGGDLRANSASGDIYIDAFLGNDIALKSVSGELHVGLPTGIRLDANMNSLSGEIHLPGTRSKPSDGDRRKVKLTAKTVSGDIRIDTFER